MERQQFDDLTRAIARGTSRRGALRALAGAMAGGLAILAGGASAAPKGGSTKPPCCPTGYDALCTTAAGPTCTNTKTDTKHCGACGNACASGATCVNGVCQGATPGCTTAADCPTPTDKCKTATCVSGTCGSTSITCSDGNACTSDTCDSSTGCVFTPLAAGTACSQNGGSVCDGAGSCVACAPGGTRSCFTGPGTPGIGICTSGTQTCQSNGTWGSECAGQVTAQAETCNGLDDDCDGIVDDGNLCPFVANANVGCVNGACAITTCNSGYGNCDGQDGNGCEVSLLTDVNHCGGCGQACTPPANATAVCLNGTCAFVCQSGYVRSGDTCVLDLYVSVLTVEPNAISVGGSAAGTVTLNTSAPADTAVTLSVSPDTVASVPGSVTVVAGQRSATFEVVGLSSYTGAYLGADLNGDLVVITFDVVA